MADIMFDGAMETFKLITCGILAGFIVLISNYPLWKFIVYSIIVMLVGFFVVLLINIRLYNTHHTKTYINPFKRTNIKETAKEKSKKNYDMKKSKKQDWHNLAQILAILSGSILIVAGFFINVTANANSAMQTNTGLIYQAKVAEPNAVPYLQESNNLLGQLVKITYKYFKWFLWSGLIVAFLSIITWFRGYKSK